LHFPVQNHIYTTRGSSDTPAEGPDTHPPYWRTGTCDLFITSSGLTEPPLAGDDIPVADARLRITSLFGSRNQEHPYRVPRHRMETKLPPLAVNRCAVGYRVSPPTIVDNGERDRALVTGRPPTDAEIMNSGKSTPLQRAFSDGRISIRFEIYAEKVEQAYRIATGHGGTASPLKVAPGKLIGAEINANAAGVCRLLKYRCGPLYGPLIAACVHGQSMADIGRRFWVGDGRLDKGEASRVGTSKVVDALRFAKGALDDIIRWECEEQAEVWPVARLLKAIHADGIPGQWHRAANDNVRQVGSIAA
jgi:hypothetical protein